VSLENGTGFRNCRGHDDPRLVERQFDDAIDHFKIFEAHSGSGAHAPKRMSTTPMQSPRHRQTTQDQRHRRAERARSIGSNAP
jgi:hypothetical protein